MWITKNRGKFLKRWDYQTTLPASGDTCMQVKKQQLEPDMEQPIWFKIEKGVCQGCVLSPCLFNLYTEYNMQNAQLDKAQAGIKIVRRNINSLRYVNCTTLMAESKDELKSLLMRVKEESERRGFRLNIKNVRSWHPAHYCTANRRGKGGSSDRFPLLGLQKHCG